MKGRTSFVVAQRISTVLKADKIVVIEQGPHCRRGDAPRAAADQPDLPGNLRFPAGEWGQRSLKLWQNQSSQQAVDTHADTATRWSQRRSRECRERSRRRAIRAGRWCGWCRILSPYKVTLAVVLFFILASTLLGLLSPYLMGLAIDDYIATKDAAGLVVIAIWMLVVFLSGNLADAIFRLADGVGLAEGAQGRAP